MGTFGEVALGERLIDDIENGGEQIDSVLHLVEGLLEGGFAHKGARLVPRLRQILAKKTLTQWEKERSYCLLLKLLQADGRLQEAHCAFEEAKSQVKQKESLLHAALAMNKAEELGDLKGEMGSFAQLSLQLHFGQWEECSDTVRSIKNESERIRALELWIERIEDRRWRSFLPELISTIPRPEKRAHLLTMLAERLVSKDMALGVQQTINEALITANGLTPFPRATIMARLVYVLKVKERVDEAIELANETMKIAAAQGKAAREGLLEQLGLHCARAGLLEIARLVSAQEEDEERRGQVECAIVKALLEKGDREGARQVVARINHPDGRVRAGAMHVEACLPVRGPTWALRQVRLILELADMRSAGKQAYAHLVPILFLCAKDECQQREAIELFSELLDIVTEDSVHSPRAA